MTRAAGPAAALMLALAGCAPTAPLPERPVGYGAPIAVEAQALPVAPDDPARSRLGAFEYAGGVVLTSRQTSRLHGLSDLLAWPDGRLLAQSDEGDLLQAKLVLDRAGRLVGLTGARISTLKDAHGVDLHALGQAEADSEAIALLPDGDLLVAFEHHARILLYPRNAGPPREVPKPAIDYRANEGMEAMAAAPDAGSDAYRVGIEATGQIFLCRLSTSCTADGQAPMEPELGLSAMAPAPGGLTAYLLRGYNPLRGNLVRLKIVDRAGRLVDELVLARPLTTENLEGVGVVPRADGRIRFYLISDDNFGVYAGLPTGQKTMLLAFDWTPPGPDGRKK